MNPNNILKIIITVLIVVCIAYGFISGEHIVTVSTVLGGLVFLKLIWGKDAE